MEDQSGNPIEFANVARTDNLQGVSTNSKGEYIFKTQPGKDIPFKCTFVGKQTVTFYVTLQPGDSVFKEIVLVQAVEELEQVEVVGDLQEGVRAR